MQKAENRRINYANLSYRKYWQIFWLQLILSVCQQQHLCSCIQTCYLKRRKKIFELCLVTALENLWAWVRCGSGRECYLCSGGKDALEARSMQIGLCFLLNSARCTEHFKNCFGAVENLHYCCLVFDIVEICWFGGATTLHQRMMAMLCASHLLSSENKCCFCFSFSGMNHCSHTSTMLNLQVSCDTDCVSGSR